MEIKTFATFENADDNMGVITDYVVGMPSGEVIDVTDEEFVKLKKERLLKYNNQKHYFQFLDLNYKTIRNLLRNPLKIQDIHNIMNKLDIANYKINADFTVDVNGDVDISQRGLSKFPVTFGRVTGNFDCSINRFTNLVGAPREIGGFFDCSMNKIYTLIGGPRYVAGGYYCMENNLEDLEGFPEYCQVCFDASKNSLITLKGTPEVVEATFFNVSHNKLKDLTKGPRKTVNFDCSYNQITTLVSPLREVRGTFDCTYNRLFNIMGWPSCGKFKYLAGNEIEEIEYD